MRSSMELWGRSLQDLLYEKGGPARQDVQRRKQTKWVELDSAPAPTSRNQMLRGELMVPFAGGYQQSDLLLLEFLP